MKRERLSKEDRKELIKEGAKRAFLEKGYKNATMEDIVRYSKTSMGGVYHHYNNKVEILYDIMSDGNLIREKLIIESIKESDLSLNELIAETIVDKMLYQSDYMRIYVMFLQEKNNDENLKLLYERLKTESIEMFINSFGEENRDKILKFIEFLTNVMNTFILGSDILDVRENFISNRDLIKKMIQVSLENS